MTSPSSPKDKPPLPPPPPPALSSPLRGAAAQRGVEDLNGVQDEGMQPPALSASPGQYGGSGSSSSDLAANSRLEERLARLERLMVATDKRVRAMEASADHMRKVIPELLLEDLAHDDRAVSAVNRVKLLLQRTFPEPCDSGVNWLGNSACTLAQVAPDTLLHIIGFLKCKFGRTALARVAPVFWMPQPSLRSAKSLASFVHGYGEAVVTLSGHSGIYAKFMGMYELDLRHIVHNYPLFKKMGMAMPHFIYKCSLNGKWLVTDEQEHCPKNLSRIGSKEAAESPDAPDMKFEIWKDNAWVLEPNLTVTEGRVKGFPRKITFSGHTGPQKRFMGTYTIDPKRVVHGYPLYKRERPPGRSDYVYKCSLNGKWLLTDDDDHFPLNLSRIGTKKGVEHLTEKGVTFEVWRSSQWHEDAELKVTVEDSDYFDPEPASSRSNSNSGAQQGSAGTAAGSSTANWRMENGRQ